MGTHPGVALPAARPGRRRAGPTPSARLASTDIDDLNPTIRGWGNHFAIGTVASLFDDLDKWIRMRLRSKVLGTKARLISRAGQKMPTRVLTGLGLVSLVDVRRSKLSPA